MAESIVGIILTLLGILAWWLKTRKEPTPDEQVQQQFQDTIANVHRLREMGRHSEAEAMLRRLSVAVGVRDTFHPAGSGNHPDANGKRVGDETAQGDADQSGKP